MPPWPRRRRSCCRLSTSPLPAACKDRTLPDLLDNPLRLWSVGGSILAPLLNRQALNAQVDVSMAQRNQALYSYEKTVRGAFKEVNDSLDAISRYGEQLAELQGQVAVAEETLRIAQNRYRNGYSSYLDVLDAQRTLFSTQLSVVQVKNNLAAGADRSLPGAGRRLDERVNPLCAPVHNRGERRNPYSGRCSAALPGNNHQGVNLCNNSGLPSIIS